jgi:hemerythrin-like domain-containing protein
MGTVSDPQLLRSERHVDSGVGAGSHGLADRTPGRPRAGGSYSFGEGRNFALLSNMLRDKNLIPLSRQHQHALALCVRIERASPIADSDLDAWQAEMAQQFRAEISVHFTAEETVLFPAARAFRELNPLIEELLSDHAWLRKQFAAAEGRKMSAAEVTAFARRLSDHIRREERRLFERLQQMIKPEEFAVIGGRLDEALKDADESCALPSETTRLRPTK